MSHPGIVEEGSTVYFGKACAVQKLIVLWASFLRRRGRSEFVDGIGRKLTALLSIGTTPSHFRILGVRGQTGANAPNRVPRVRLRDLDWKLGVMMWRDSSSLDAAQYMTKRSMGPVSADHDSPGNTGVPVPSMTWHCMCMMERSGRRISGQ